MSNLSLQVALQEAIAGGLGTVFSCSLTYPLDYAKSRLQLPGSEFSSLSDALIRIARDEGPIQLYDGLNAELLKGSLQNFIYFFTYSFMKAFSLSKGIGVVSSPAAPSVLTRGPSASARFDSMDVMSPGLRYIFCRDRSPSVIELEKRGVYGRLPSQGAPSSLASPSSTLHSQSTPHLSDTSAPQPKHQSHIHNNTLQVPVASTTQHLTAPSPSSSNNASSSPVHISSVHRRRELGIGANLLIGLIAGSITQLFTNPISVIQTRLINANRRAGARKVGMVEVFQGILAKEGIQAFWSGLIPALILTFNPAIQFLVFDKLKALVIRIKAARLQSADKNNTSDESSVTLNAAESFLIGALAKIAATIVTYPYIMAKLRLQLQANSNGTIGVLLNILRQEGFAGLYKGMSAQLLKSVLGAALMFMAKEKLLDITAAIMNPTGALKTSPKSKDK